MNVFTIGKTPNSLGIGYCISDLNEINCTFGELIGKTFKTTNYSRNYSDGIYSTPEKSVKVYDYNIKLFPKPKNSIIESHSWEQITLDNLKDPKRYKYFHGFNYNGHIVYVGLNYVSEENLNEMEDKKTYNTTYYYGCGVDPAFCSGAFDVIEENNKALNMLPNDVLINECKKRGLL